MESRALMSSARSDWQTPQWFLDLVRAVDDIALDPCTSPNNPTGAKRFLTQDSTQCGLEASWLDMADGGLVFVNPPYGRSMSGSIPEPAKNRGWAAKMALASHGLYLVPARTETFWFRRLHNWCDWRLDWSSRFHGSRIAFIDPAKGRPAGNVPFPSTVFYRGPKGDAFAEVFQLHGTLIRARCACTVL